MKWSYLDDFGVLCEALELSNFIPAEFYIEIRGDRITVVRRNG